MEPTFGIKFSLCRYVALNMSIAYEWDAVMQEHQSRNPDFHRLSKWIGADTGRKRFDFLFEFKEVTMIQELQLRILPEEAVSEQSLKQVVARETGISVPYIHTVRVLKRSIDARQRTIYVNVKLRAFINEQPDEPEFQLVEYKDVSAGKPVVVVGAGPGGLFAALRLIELGLRPIVIERGRTCANVKGYRSDQP